MKSWWDLGEWSGHHGDELAVYQIACPFCLEQGNFSTEYQATKKKPNSSKALHFDTLKCGSCGGYVMVLWSASEFSGPSRLHDYRVLPWPTRIDKWPKHWPHAVGNCWVQAHRSAKDENWDAAAVMARSALQAALREQGAHGTSLRGEIDGLAAKGLLPPHMKEWAHELRELGNESAHPDPSASKAAPGDVWDVLQFVDFLLQYLYNLPHEIQEYRVRRAAKPREA